MMRLTGFLFTGLALLALEAPGATLSIGAPASDALNLDSLFPPALEAHPADPDRALVGLSENGPGVVGVRIAPGLPLTEVGTPYLLPGNLNCTESSPFLTPRLGGFSLEPLPGPSRGWITTSSCELAVPFDYATGSGITIAYAGQLRTAVPTRHTLAGSFTRYQASGTGAAITSFRTNFTGAALRVGNRLVVSTSNVHQAGSSPVFNPGTVLLFDLDESVSPPTVTPASPFFLLTSDPNPVALTALPGGRVLVTNAGIHDAAFPPLVTGVGSIDVLDPAAGRWVGSIPLGSANPGGRSLAVDPTGSVALAGSQTARQLFAVDVRGLDALSSAPVDPGLQRPSCNATSAASAGGLPCLRARVIRGSAAPIVLPPPPGSSGPWSLVPQVRFAASGAFAVASSFNDGGLGLVAFDARNVGLPHPLLASRFGAPETLRATAAGGAIGEECCPGPFVLRASPDGALAGTQVAFATGSPNGVIVRGTFGGTLAPPGGDHDGDGVEDALDNCPVAANPDQEDSGGLETSAADRIGDVCQCGDPDDDGRIDAADLMALRRFRAGALAALDAPAKCDVGGTAACDLVDVVRLARARAGLAPGIAHACAPFHL
jgi:hypothetical protein